MGLADFLVEAGRGTSAANVGRAFGGTNQRLDNFINNEMPGLVQEIQNNTDETKMPALQMKFIQSSLNAGLPPQAVDHLSGLLVGAHVQGMREDQLNKFREDLQGQPASPRPQTGNDLVKGPDVPAVPPRPIDPEMAVRFGQAIGANPDLMTKLLSTPADIAAKQASTAKTQGEIDKEAVAARQRQGLSNVPLAPGQPSMQDVGILNPPGLQQFLPPRNEDYMNQMIGLKQQGLENTLAMAGQRIGAANDRASLAESRAGFNQAAELRKEFQSQSKGFQQVRDSFNRIQTSGQSPTPAGDLSMLYNYMKMLDPGARVTEQDFRSAATAKPMMERLGLSWDAIGSIWGGQKMTPGMRQDFLSRASQIYNAESQQHGKRVNEYTRLATGQGLNPANVITDMEATGEAPPPPQGQGRYSEGVPSGSAQAAPPPPAPGTIYKGHRFKGGNPADKKNWEKVQGQ